MSVATILKNREMPYLGNGMTDHHQIWHGDAIWPSPPGTLQ